MKVYYHHNPGGFSNCYIVVNEAVKEAIIIDPGKVTDEIVSQIEENDLSISGILITHNHGSHVHGLKTLRKIYSPKIYAADWEVAKDDTTVISRDGSVKIAKLTVDYMAVPGHTSEIKSAKFIIQLMTASKTMFISLHHLIPNPTLKTILIMSLIFMKK